MSNQYKTNLDYIIEIIVFILFIGGIALGMQLNYYLFSISFLTLIFVFFYQKKKKKRLNEFQNKIIRSQWGKGPKVKAGFEYRDFLYKFLLKDEKDFIIDNITWQDLNMDVVFSKMDHTMSLPGMQYLYYILRKPIFERELLIRRKNKIISLKNNKSISQEIQFPLFLLGKDEGEGIFEYFHEGIKVDTRPLKLYKLLSYLPILALGLGFYDIKMGIGLFIFIAMINAIIYISNKHKIAEEIETFKLLGNLINCGERISKINMDSLEIDTREIEILLKNLNKIKKNISKINFNEESRSEIQILIDYYNMAVLKEPKIFYQTVKELNKHREDFLKIYILIGEIDAYISIASYISELNYYTEPSLKNEDDKFHLIVEDLYHPLLEDPVPYTFEFNNRGALITGSNASGKSTFLRTIGINAIFAQTLYIVLAKNYSSSYFRLFTSIGTTDSIVDGDSYFMAEAKALKRIIDVLNPNEPILCILDEIFRGTNTAERISAAMASLDYMSNKNACIIAATHDLELTTLVNNKYDNYHFKETIKDKDMIFDYVLKPGPCNSRNAISILGYLDYPKEIYEKAIIQADLMEAF